MTSFPGIRRFMAGGCAGDGEGGYEPAVKLPVIYAMYGGNKTGVLPLLAGSKTDGVVVWRFNYTRRGGEEGRAGAQASSPSTALLPKPLQRRSETFCLEFSRLSKDFPYVFPARRSCPRQTSRAGPPFGPGPRTQPARQPRRALKSSGGPGRPASTAGPCPPADSADACFPGSPLSVILEASSRS